MADIKKFEDLIAERYSVDDVVEDDGGVRIAFIGGMRSGKSTVALTFMKPKSIVLSFGSALKYHAREIFPYLQGESKPRTLYQDLGQKMREIDEDVWIRHVVKDMRMFQEYGVENFYIDDLRQPNEYEWAKRNGFYIVRVDVDEETRYKRAIAKGDAFERKDMSHETESHYEGFDVDFVIDNNGTWSDTLKQIEEIKKEVGLVD